MKNVQRYKDYFFINFVQTEIPLRGLDCVELKHVGWFFIEKCEWTQEHKARAALEKIREELSPSSRPIVFR